MQAKITGIEIASYLRSIFEVEGFFAGLDGKVWCVVSHGGLCRSLFDEEGIALADEDSSGNPQTHLWNYGFLGGKFCRQISKRGADQHPDRKHASINRNLSSASRRSFWYVWLGIIED